MSFHEAPERKTSTSSLRLEGGNALARHASLPLNSRFASRFRQNSASPDTTSPQPSPTTGFSPFSMQAERPVQDSLSATNMPNSQLNEVCAFFQLFLLVWKPSLLSLLLRHQSGTSPQAPSHTAEGIPLFLILPLSPLTLLQLTWLQQPKTCLRLPLYSGGIKV